MYEIKLMWEDLALWPCMVVPGEDLALWPCMVVPGEDLALWPCMVVPGLHVTWLVHA